MKRWQRALGFVLMAAAALTAAGGLLRPRGEETALPEHSIDVAFLGTSLSYCAFNTVTLYRDYGVASYNYARQRQPLSMTYYTLKNLFRTQSPKVVVLETYALSFQTRYATDDDPGVAAASLNAVSHPLDRAGMVFSSVEPELWPLYLIPALTYHDRWRDLGKDREDQGTSGETARLCGFVAEFAGGSAPEPDLAALDTDLEYRIPARNLRWLRRIARLCRERGAELVLVKTPLPISAYSAALSRAVRGEAEELGADYIDLSVMTDRLGLDFSADTLDDAHLNALGAEKTTGWMGAYLTEHFSLHDCRGDGDDAWRDALRQYMEIRTEATAGYEG